MVRPNALPKVSGQGIRGRVLGQVHGEGAGGRAKEPSPSADAREMGLEHGASGPVRRDIGHGRGPVLHPSVETLRASSETPPW